MIKYFIFLLLLLLLITYIYNVNFLYNKYWDGKFSHTFLSERMTARDWWKKICASVWLIQLYEISWWCEKRIFSGEIFLLWYEGVPEDNLRLKSVRQYGCQFGKIGMKMNILIKLMPRIERFFLINVQICIMMMSNAICKCHCTKCDKKLNYFKT